MTSSGTALQRTLTLRDAVLLGCVSMVGAGVFVVWGPAAASAGAWLPLALGLALLVAWCNALSSARLAVAHPNAGGAYIYGRERLGPWWGFAAGWCFVVGKTASVGAMALAVAAYLAPERVQRPVAVLTVLVLTAVAALGVQRSTRVAAGLLALGLAGLGTALIIGLTSGASSAADPGSAPEVTWYAVAQAAGLLFFAFAGYARVTTLAEEVRDPTRTIPLGVIISLSITGVIYLAVGLTLLHSLGATALADSTAPVLEMAGAAGDWAGPLVTVAAVCASAGALVALLVGISRTAMAMARTGDLPAPLTRVNARGTTPWVAQCVVGLVAAIAVAILDLREVIGFSSFGVLLYYAVSNAAALTRRREGLALPWVVPALGLTLCLALSATLPLTSVLWGSAVVIAGLAYRALRLALRHRTRSL